MGNPELLAQVAATAPNPALDLPTAISRYLKGESIQILAAEFGCDRSTLYRRMKAYTLAYDGPEYADLITHALVDRIAHADQLLEESVDPVATSRAREMARFARMDLERRRPKLYGMKQEITKDERITVVIARQPVDITPKSLIRKDIEVMLPVREQDAGKENDEHK